MSRSPCRRGLAGAGRAGAFVIAGSGAARRRRPSPAPARPCFLPALSSPSSSPGFASAVASSLATVDRARGGRLVEVSPRRSTSRSAGCDRRRTRRTSPATRARAARSRATSRRSPATARRSARGLRRCRRARAGRSRATPTAAARSRCRPPTTPRASADSAARTAGRRPCPCTITSPVTSPVDARRDQDFIAGAHASAAIVGRDVGEPGGQLDRRVAQRAAVRRLERRDRGRCRRLAGHATRGSCRHRRAPRPRARAVSASLPMPIVDDVDVAPAVVVRDRLLDVARRGGSPSTRSRRRCRAPSARGRRPSSSSLPARIDGDDVARAGRRLRRRATP